MRKQTYVKVFSVGLIILIAVNVPLLFIDAKTLMYNDLFLIPPLMGLICCAICLACVKNPFGKNYNGELLRGEKDCEHRIYISPEEIKEKFGITGHVNDFYIQNGVLYKKRLVLVVDEET